ncbi:MAG: right-handed parallel beta-helix repeat-containing protein, partial [Lachnospiraceae bacterium]|nr:right-handed parallel beta-helix repeat-containing protein [Lachnospiraceae bacterium]
MKRRTRWLCAMALTGLMVLNVANPAITAEAAGVADFYQIPSADANGRVGASVPYTRYDSMQAQIGGGAAIKSSHDFDRMNIASQASEQSYVRLPGSGSYAQWTMNTTGAGVTMRFTMPDSGSNGLNGSLDVYVNNHKVKTVNLTSYYMWQYFAQGNPSDTNDGGAPCFAFDEVHFLLNTPLKEGDVLKIQSSGAGGLEYGIDFVEVENVPDPIYQPAGSVNVEDFGAVPDDGQDDYNAIYQAIEYADSHNMDVYIPAGTFHIGQTWRLYGSDMKITGAGMWYTNIQFTSNQPDSGGISGGWQTSGPKDGYCKNIEFCNMYINSNLNTRYNQQAIYKCFMDVYTDGSVIHDIWEEHFECGFWFGDYNGKMDYSDGVKVINCRIRNNLADGVNFCQGTSNAVVYNCNIRNNGDDGLAMWNNTYGNAKDETGNIFAYNTIEFIWRAGGIAIYGGSGHRVYNNYLCDMFMAAGIHLNTTFDGYKFSNNNGIYFDNNILVRCGTSSDSWKEELGAVDVKQNVSNVVFNNTQIYDAQHEGVRILDNSPTGIVFNNTKILGAGVD